MGDLPHLIGILIMGPYKPLLYWVDEFIPYCMEIMGVDQPDRTCDCIVKSKLETIVDILEKDPFFKQIYS